MTYSRLFQWPADGEASNLVLGYEFICTAESDGQFHVDMISAAMSEPINIATAGSIREVSARVNVWLRDQIAEAQSAALSQSELLLPTVDFIAAPACPSAPLVEASGVDSRHRPMFRYPAPEWLAGVPHAQEHWAYLHTYMHRRFGPAPIGGDDYKDLSASWLLSTPDPDVFLLVSPSLNGPYHSFSAYVKDSGGEGSRRTTPLAEDVIQRTANAARIAVLDLLRPVAVRDQWINAVGIVSDDSPLLEEGDEDNDYDMSGGLPLAAKFAASAGYGMPLGLFGGKDWPRFCRLLEMIGEGDIAAGRQQVIDMLTIAHLRRVADTPIPVRVMVAATMALSDEDGLRRYVPLLGLGEGDAAAAATFYERLNARDSAEAESFPDIAEADLDAAIGILEQLGLPDASLQFRVREKAMVKRCRAAWLELKAAWDQDGDFPDAVLDLELWQVPMQTVPALLRDCGAYALASWAEACLEQRDGGALLYRLLWSLQQSQQESGAAGGDETPA
jgi:hypothetical protein